MENNDDFNDLKKNLAPNINDSSGLNNITDPNVNNYLNQPFLPRPYMIGNPQQYNSISYPQNNPNSPGFNDFGEQRNILFISNLPFNTNETDIKLFFKKYGDSITHMSINPRSFKQSETAPMSAKVVFKDPITANNARIEMNLRKLKGHAIRLMWEEHDNSMRYNSTSNIFIKGIPFNVQPREVYEYFLQYGDISSAKINEDAEGNHLGYGYVTYYDKTSADEAIKGANGKNLWGGAPILVEHFKKKNERISTSGPEVPKLYISNFPGDYTQEQILELTKEFGPILSINFATEKVGRRYALVCYELEESANKAKESLEGKNVGGYNLLCKIIKEKNNQVEFNNKKYPVKETDNKRLFQKNNFGQNLCNLHIKNIPYQIKEKEFNEIFGKYGKIVSSKLVCCNLINNTGGQFSSVQTSKGFGFVCYEDPEVAKKVKEELDHNYLPGYEYWKNPLIINYHQTKSQKAMNNLMNMNYQNNYNNYNNYGYNNNFNFQNTNNEVLEFSMEKFKTITDEEKKKEYLGEYIVDYILNNKFLKDFSEEKQLEYNEKITGIILESSPLDQVADLCQDKKALNQQIFECLEMLIKKNNCP